jgi:hypothetical protein
VHIALLQAQSYQKTINDKYYSENDSLYDAARRYVDMFGVMQKIPNALDILIEDAKNHLKTWGSPPPTFLLCPSDLTAQLQMNPERTNYITNGPDGLKRLAQGPDLPSYRGLSIIHSQKFSLEPGRKPRNVLKRRVRVAEYYWIPLADVSSYQLYNQKKDMMTTFDRTHALRASGVTFSDGFNADYFGNGDQWSKLEPLLRDGYCLLIRPNIEHEMLTVIAGRGGTQELGATFWGQTELACYDDAQHGIWGMSYKYHERAIVTNERNLIRMHDVAFDGYGGGMDTDIVKNTDLESYTSQTYNNEPHFKGPSVIALHFPRYLPPRAIENQIISMMMDIFVCDPDDRCSTTLNDSQLEFRSKVLQAIATALKTFLAEHNDYFAVLRALDEDDGTGRIRLEREKTDIKANNWSAFTTDICAMIRSVHTVYRTARPHEDPYEVYRRILQTTYKTLYAPAHSMSLATANRVLSYLVNNTTGRDTKSDAFKRAFDATMALMLLNKSMMTTNTINNDIATVQGSISVGANRINIKTYMTYLIHGYIIDNCNDNDFNQWDVHVETGGARIKRVVAIFPSDAGNDDSDKDNLFDRLLVSIHTSPLDDYRYLVHRMQKPAFEVPNPVILGTFLGNRTTPVPVDAEGSQMIDKEGKHDFAKQLLQYFAETGDFEQHCVIMQSVIQKMFEKYRTAGSYLWTGGNSMPASAYMQNSTTELPSLAYHGNLTIDRTLKGREDIRCVGHLGNSFPGCACIRQGKGMLNMYERQPTAVHVM